MTTDPEDSRLTLQVQHVYKSFGDSAVLNDMSLKIEEGTIYGLLGPSGCGKTTFLRAIMGRCPIDSGYIRVAASRISDIGYMPQNLCLHLDMSISDTLSYYSWIFKIKPKDKISRSKELFKLLELPHEESYIKNLSGGQQRRVSLAVSLLHNPMVLILDEPTVGLDPIHSYNIWTALLEMTKEGKTILITTHYVEEAKRAHKIGFMKNGRIEADDSPSYLLQTYNKLHLEDVFLELCIQNSSSSFLDQGNLSVSVSQITPFDNNPKFSFDRMLSQTRKVFLLMKRNFLMTSFLFALPFFIYIFFDLAVGHNTVGLPLAVINHELENSIQTCPKYNNTCFLESTENLSFSCIFMKNIQRQFPLIEYSDQEIALKDFKRKKIYGILIFKENFTSHLIDRVSLGLGVDSETIPKSNSEMILEYDDVITIRIVKRLITKALFLSLHDFYGGCTDVKDPRSIQVPIKFQEPIYGLDDQDYYSFAVVGMNVVNVFYTACFSSAAFLIDEKQQGAMERAICAGISIFEVLLSYFCILLCVTALQIVEVICISYGFIGQIMVGSYTLLYFHFLFIGSFGLIVGLTLALVNKHITSLAFLVMGINICVMFITGSFWPIEGVHKNIKFIAENIPLTNSISILRSVTQRGSGFFFPLVAKGFLIESCWFLISVAIIYWIAKKQASRW